MDWNLSRRNFLKSGLATFGLLAFNPSQLLKGISTDVQQVRVATTSVSVYSEPNDKSQILYTRYRDDILNVYYEITSEYGPGYNPIWYRVWNGYIHRAHLQKIKTVLNPVMHSITGKAQLVEVTIPFSQAMRYTKYTGWQPIYRLYYGTTHWVVGIDEGPDGEAWYRIRDELLDMDYHATATHFRPIPPEELTPIRPEIPAKEKRIDINLTKQELVALEYGKEVFKTKISSGVPDAGRTPANGIPTRTPKGNFFIQSKMASKHMGDGQLTDDLDAYVLPGVPWCCFIDTKIGVAIHGTYWHQNFGVPMSHGCINMWTDEAKWIFRWTTPAVEPDEIEKRAIGTTVIVTA